MEAKRTVSGRVVTTGAEATGRRGLARASSMSPEERATALACAKDYQPSIGTATTTEFVRSVGAALIEKHDQPQEALRAIMPAVAGFAVYCAAKNIPLKNSSLDPYTINQYAVVLRKDRPDGAATYQTRLRRIGRLLNPRAPWEDARPVGRRAVKQPCSDVEIAALERDIKDNLPSRARIGETLLVLGLGAGLDTRWALKIDPVVDIVDHGEGGIDVHVDGRVVTVLAKYETRLRKLIASTRPGDFLQGGRRTDRNAANEMIHRIQLAPSTPALDPGRLRATWIVGHLDRGTNLKLLADQAGVQGATTFSDLIEFMSPLPAESDTSRRAMRGRRR